MLKKDDEDVFGIPLIYLSEAFDCIPHEIIAKLQAYAFHTDALKPVHNYLSKKKERVKLNDAYYTWKYIIYHLPRDRYCVVCYLIYIYVSYFTFW